MRYNLIIGLCIVLAVSIAPGFAQTINECTNITVAGSYNLTANISGLQSGKDYCIGIFADDVILDGQGFTITGYSSGIGILVQANNVTITNVSVSEYSYGIYFDSSNNTKIANSYISYNDESCIELQNSNNNTIEDCVIESNGEGIYIYYSSNNVINNCTISNNSRAGISLDASNNTITNCTITNNHEAGIDLGSNNNFIANNEVRNNNQAESWDYGGILLYRANDTIVLNNLISGNKIYGVHIERSQNNTFNNNEIVNNCGGEAGIYLYEAENLTFENNNVSENTGYGFLIGYSNNITIYNNTISGNYYDGICFESSNSNGYNSDCNTSDNTG